MILCHCAVVGDREIVRAVEAGATTVAAVCRTTGAGQQCGTCVFSVRRVVCDHRTHARDRDQARPGPPIGVDVAAS